MQLNYIVIVFIRFDKVCFFRCCVVLSSCSLLFDVRYTSVFCCCFCCCCLLFVSFVVVLCCHPVDFRLTLDTNLCFVEVVVVVAVVCFFRCCVVLSSCSLSFDVRL